MDPSRVRRPEHDGLTSIGLFRAGRTIHANGRAALADPFHYCMGPEVGANSLHIAKLASKLSSLGWKFAGGPGMSPC